jgi:hypothetical protein
MAEQNPAPGTTSGPADAPGARRGVIYTYVVKLYDNVDKQKLLSEVREMQAEDAYLTPTDHARRVIAETKAAASSAGVVSGMTSLVPVIGAFLSIPSLGTEIAYLLAQEVYLVLKIAALFGFDVNDRSRRLDELFAILGREDPRVVTSGMRSEASREALRKVAGRGLVKVAQQATLRLGSRLLPFVGSVVGGLLNFSSAEEAGEMALRYYQTSEPDLPRT